MNVGQFIYAQTGNKYISDIVFNEGQVIGGGEFPGDKTYACVLRIRAILKEPSYFSTSEDGVLFDSTLNEVGGNFLNLETTNSSIQVGEQKLPAFLKCGKVSFKYETVSKGGPFNRTNEQVRTNYWNLIETNSDSTGVDSIYALTFPQIFPLDIGLWLVKK